ncbi:protein FAM149B1-like [Saccoglossus kowalevskii]
MAAKVRNRNVLIEVRGIASRGENHPLPEKAEDPLPFPYIDTVNEAISSFITPTTSGRSSPTLENHSWLSASNEWTAGNSTDRRSLFSWADDEFDRRAARTVRQMFEEIDRMLFEAHSTQGVSQQLIQECKDWNTRFPHLRILGLQLIQPQDAGFQVYPQEAPRPSTGNMLLDVGDNEMVAVATTDTQGLTIQGHHLDAVVAPTNTDTRTTSPNHQFAHLEEEIFESDGCIEEYLAFDKIADDEVIEQKKYHNPRPRRLGFPPITPNACLQDTINNQVFDAAWSEIITWLRPLVKKYVDRTLAENEVTRQIEESDLLSQLGPLENVYNLPSPPLSRGFPKMASIQSSMKLSKPINLADVMQIGSKTIHTRKGKNDDALTNRPHSSALNRGRPLSTKYQGPRYMNRKPLKPIGDRSKTPMTDEYSLLALGTKLKTPADPQRLGSPPHPSISPPYHTWSNRLPPIETVQEEYSPTTNLKHPVSLNESQIL